MAATTEAQGKPSQQRRTVHIRVRYEGRGEPGPLLSERCDTLVNRLVLADAGVVDRRSAGEGAVDIFVTTRFADHTTEQARRIVHELGLTLRTTVRLVTEKAKR